MQQNLTLKAAGLFTFPNELGSIPDGALKTASNVVVDKDGTISQRRGMKLYGTEMTTTASQLMVYQNRIIRHYNNTLDVDSDGAGTFTQLYDQNDNPISVVDSTTGVRLKYQEANGNLYFTSATGVRKLSCDSDVNISAQPVTDAGGIAALDGSATLNSTTGWFTQDSTVAYRIVWGVTDTNNNVVLGVPSERIIIDNSQLTLMVSDYNNLINNLATAVAIFPATPITATGTTNSTTTLTLSAANTSLLVGMPVSATDIPFGTYIAAISGATITLSKAATASTVGETITFGVLEASGVLNGTTTVTGLPSTAPLSLGMTVTGTDIPSGTTIVGLGKTSITLSQAATGSTTTTLSFGQALKYNNYSSLLISSNSNAVVLWDALQTLANGDTNVLDTDLGYQKQQSVAVTVQSFTATGTTTANSNIITSLSSLMNISVGSPVSSNIGNFPVGTYVTGIDPATGNISVSELASSNGTPTLTFGPNFATSGISDYFSLWSAQNTTEYIVYYTSQNSVAPAQPVNAVMVPITVGISDTAEQIAVNTANALSNLTYTNTTTNEVSQVFNCSTPSSGSFIVYNGSASIPAYGYANPPSYTPSNSTYPALTVAVSQVGVNPVFGILPLTPSSTPAIPTTTGTLAQLQTYYDSIVNVLNTTPGISAFALTGALGGGFNNSTQSSTVNLTFTIPKNITSAYFYQIYRSAIFSSSQGTYLTEITPDDELQLIYEANPTSAQLAAKVVTFFDDVPDSFRTGGTYLYTNANSGQGIDQANTVPPLCQDLTLFLNNTFYANTSLKYSVEAGLLTGVGLAGNNISITQGETTNTYNFVIPQVVEVDMIAGDLFTPSGVSDSIDLFSANNAKTYRVWFQVGSSTAPSNTGVTLVEVPILSTDSDSQVAIKFINALNTYSDFSVSQVDNIVEITNSTFGAANAPVNNVVNSSFVIQVDTTGVGSSNTTNPVSVSTLPTPAQVIDATARNLVHAINTNPSEVIYAYYVSDVNGLPGLINFEVQNYSSQNFYITSNNTATAALFNPTLGLQGAITSISVANPTVVTSASHGLSNNDSVFFKGTNSTPSIDGLQTVTVIDANTFSVPVNVTMAGTTGTFYTTDIEGNNDPHPNRIFFSKNGEPEAVPLVNYLDIGPKNSAIVRILPLRSSLMILSQAGIYQLSGTDPTNFQVQLFDGSTKITAPDSAQVLNNQVFMFSNQGVVAVSETGVSVISRPIEDQILPLLTPQYTNFLPATFAVGYEADRAYLLGTVSETGDTVATIVFRWNTFTSTWTTFDMSKTCGAVIPSQNVLYLGASDTNYIEMERKTFTRIDQADREYIINLPVNGVNGNVINFESSSNVVEGDAFVQTQYLTLAQFNRLLQQLDTDQGLTYKSYYSSLQASPGFDLRSSITLLAEKLDADSGIASHVYVSSIAGYGSSSLNQQQAFNTITTLLISDAGTKVKNYPQVTAVNAFETIVISVNTRNNNITLQWAMPFISGDITQYKAIDSIVEWAPHHFGDASMTKQVSESTLLFNNFGFTQATASYSSDLAPGFIPVPISGPGPGIFGGFTFGDSDNFGGTASSYPFRTLIPGGKQRCRYIMGQFEHAVAREVYQIYGISYTYTMTSMRGYR